MGFALRPTRDDRRARDGSFLDRARPAGCAAPRWPHMGVRDSRGRHRDRGADPDRELRVPITHRSSLAAIRALADGGKGPKVDDGRLRAPNRARAPYRASPVREGVVRPDKLSGPTKCPYVGRPELTYCCRRKSGPRTSQDARKAGLASNRGLRPERALISVPVEHHNATIIRSLPSGVASGSRGTKASIGHPLAPDSFPLSHSRLIKATTGRYLCYAP